MDITPQAIIEDLIDAVGTGDVAEGVPSLVVQRLSPDAIEVDFGLPDVTFVIRVETKRRT